MSNVQPIQSFRETREQNLSKQQYITVILSNQYLEASFTLRCLGCGYGVFTPNNEIKAIIMGKIESKDAVKSTDQKCRKCKVTYRII